MAKVTLSRKKITRAESDKEFENLDREEEKNRAVSNPKAEEMERLRNQEIWQAVEGISVDAVVQKISGMGLEISKSLSELSGKLVSEVEKLTTIREAVSLEQRELERLHKIDIVAASMDNMLQDYHSKKEELESEIASQRAAWEEEEISRAQNQKDFEDNLKKQRQREMEEYEYKKALERKKAQDKYEEEIRLLEKKIRKSRKTSRKAGSSAKPY
jgi:colicin import membrane protein